MIDYSLDSFTIQKKNGNDTKKCEVARMDKERYEHEPFSIAMSVSFLFARRISFLSRLRAAFTCSREAFFCAAVWRERISDALRSFEHIKSKSIKNQ